MHKGPDGTAPKVIGVALATLHGDSDRLPQAHYFYDTRVDIRDDLPKPGGSTGIERLPCGEWAPAGPHEGRGMVTT